MIFYGHICRSLTPFALNKLVKYDQPGRTLTIVTVSRVNSAPAMCIIGAYKHHVPHGTSFFRKIFSLRTGFLVFIH